MAACSLSTLLPAALLWATEVGANTFPATVEVDLIFPRNETYAPSAIFPIVFAFQNAALVPSLNPVLDMLLWDSAGNDIMADQPYINLQWNNFSSHDPTYVYTYVVGLDTDGVDGAAPASHALNWGLTFANCSNETGALVFAGGSRSTPVFFTIQSGAKQPDLVASTAGSSSCADISHFAFNLTGTLNVSFPAVYGGCNTCAVFSDGAQTLVAGNPCAARVNPDTASSILAALTATACAAPRPVISCESTTSAPAKGWKTGYAGGFMAGVFLVAFVVARWS
ncbi:hypothetical protein GE09DRAFT_315742 [Coniochaeta sp. 2T2.1]|nr:hypothetical protein GE09DRAFT_315742 [Coniochaeta sp. 2T2.1]